MHKLKALLFSGGAKESALLSGGNVLSTGISAIAVILLSKYMGPATYGAFSLGFALSMLTTEIFDFGYNMSLQKYLSKEVHSPLANSLVSHGVQVKTLGTVAILVAALMLSPWLASLLHLDSPGIVYLGIGLGAIVYWFDFLAYILQGLSRFTGASAMAVSQAGAKVVIITLLILFSSLTAFKSYMAYGLAPLIGLALGFYLLRDKFKPGPKLPATLRRSLWQMTKFTGVLTIATALTDYLDIFLVQNYTSQYQTGLYSAASRVALLIAVVAYSVNSVLNTRVAKYHELPVLKSYYKKALLMAGLCLLLMVLFIPFSKILLFITAGTAYLEVDPTLKLLLASGFVALATAPLAAIFYGLEFPAYFAISGVLQVSLLVIFDLFLLPQMGLYGAGLARLLMRLLILGFTLIIIPWLFRKKAKLHVNPSPL